MHYYIAFNNIFFVLFNSFSSPPPSNKHTSNIAMKLDLTKAFDPIEWSYILMLLHKYQFPISFINFVHQFLTIIQISIRYNNTRTPYFHESLSPWKNRLSMSLTLHLRMTLFCLVKLRMMVCMKFLISFSNSVWTVAKYSISWNHISFLTKKWLSILSNMFVLCLVSHVWATLVPI